MKLPRLDTTNEPLSDAEGAQVMGLVADNLEAAHKALQGVGGRIGREGAALAQAHTLQALGLAVYALLGIGGGRD